MNMRVTEGRDTSGLVQKYIGTAYDNVKKVADSLDSIIEVIDALNEYKNTWQGDLPEHPDLRPDGTALQDGDRYYNTSTRNVYVYSNGGWRNSNTVISATEVHTIAAENLVGDDTVITLTGSYAPGTASLKVFVGGVYQYSIEDDPSGAYTETDLQTITFPDTLLGIGEVVTVDVITSVNVINPTIGVTTAIYYPPASETAITLPNNINYTPGRNNLAVYKNGLLQVSGVNYTESSPTSIIMSAAVAPGDVLVFKTGELITTDLDTETELYMVATFASFYESREFLTPEKLVVAKGGYAAGDGLGGFYVYSATAERSKANGVTLIDSTLPFELQGTGTGSGCWVRNYDKQIYPEWFQSPAYGILGLTQMKPLNGDACDIYGFYELSTVGGGSYVFFESIGSEFHDGGTVISPHHTATPGTAAWYTAEVGAPSGCWVRALGTGRLSMEYYGIDKNVNADNGPHFAAAAAAGASLNTAVEIPPGTYKCDQVVVGDFYSFGAVSITGSGSVSTIKNLLA